MANTGAQAEQLEVCVPASIANLGPGFDALAVAVELYLRVRVRTARQDGQGELRFDFIDQRLEGENFIERAFRHLATKYGTDFPSLECEVRSEIPMQAGLGSSAAATVAGLKLYDAIVGAVPQQVMLNAACELEGHPDNPTAALLGGLTCSCQLQDGSVIALATPWPDAVRFVVLTPAVPLQTTLARGTVPSRFSRPDAIYNLQRVALMLQALHAGRYSLLKEALRDCWHQPFRQALVPGLEQALALEHPDLLGLCLSGAGPSLVAFAENNFSTIEELLARMYEPLGIPFQVRTLRAHQPAQAMSAYAPVSACVP
jgi:homoserine kinase